MKTPKFETHALATRLIKEAEAAAVQMLEGQPADGPRGEQDLRTLARQIKANILAQVLLGQWSELGVNDADQLQPLVVRVQRQRIPARINVKYDFTKTVLANLLVERRSPS